MFYNISPYAYVMNNPLRYTDPTGMYPNTGVASSFVDPSGKIIEVRDDDDRRIYLVHDPSNWDGSKTGLLTIGFTPEPTTFKNHIGQNINSKSVLDFWASEANKAGRGEIFMAWKLLGKLDMLSEYRRNQEASKKVLLELQQILKELKVTHRAYGKNSEKLMALEESKKLKFIAGLKVLLGETAITLATLEMDLFIPPHPYGVAWLLDTDAELSRIESQLNKKLQEIDIRYDSMQNDVYNKSN